MCRCSIFSSEIYFKNKDKDSFKHHLVFTVDTWGSVIFHNKPRNIYAALLEYATEFYESRDSCVCETLEICIKQYKQYSLCNLQLINNLKY